jgi:hypothetical protein
MPNPVNQADNPLSSLARRSFNAAVLDPLSSSLLAPISDLPAPRSQLLAPSKTQRVFPLAFQFPWLAVASAKVANLACIL